MRTPLSSPTFLLYAHTTCIVETYHFILGPELACRPPSPHPRRQLYSTQRDCRIGPRRMRSYAKMRTIRVLFQAQNFSLRANGRLVSPNSLQRQRLPTGRLPRTYQLSRRGAFINPKLKTITDHWPWYLLFGATRLNLNGGLSSTT